MHYKIFKELSQSLRQKFNKNILADLAYLFKHGKAFIGFPQPHPNTVGFCKNLLFAKVGT